jgi:hypothetical protein
MMRYSDSFADPNAISRKREKSASEQRPHPSAMFAGMDTAARRNWLVRPYNTPLPESATAVSAEYGTENHPVRFQDF